MSWLTNHWEFFVGTLLSLLLFILGYRKTIGSKIERIKNTNTELEKAIIRGFIVENRMPGFDEIKNAIEGLAMCNKLKNIDLYSPVEILQVATARIMTSEMLSPKQRDEYLAKVDGCIKLYQDANEEFIKDEAQEKAPISSINLLVLATITTALIGFFITLILNNTQSSISNIQISSLFNNQGFFNRSPIMAGLTSLLISGLFVIVQIYKNALAVSPSSKIESLREGISFERKVQKLLINHNMPFNHSEKNDFDFQITLEDGQIMIETMGIPHGSTRLESIFKNKIEALKKNTDSEIWLIVPKEVAWASKNYVNAKIMTINEFDREIQKIKSNGFRKNRR